MKNNIKPPDLTNNPRLEDGIGGKRLFLSDEDFQKEAENGYQRIQTNKDNSFFKKIELFLSTTHFFMSEKEALLYLINHPDYNNDNFSFRVWAEPQKNGNRWVYSGRFHADLGNTTHYCEILGWDLLYNGLQNITKKDIENLIPKKRDC